MLARAKEFIGFNPLTWAAAVPRMRRRVRAFIAAHPGIGSAEGGSGTRCLVVVSPWLGTSIPWFSLAVGLMLAARGARVSFIVDDCRFGPNAARFGFILAAIRLVVRNVRKHFEVLYLSRVEPVAADADAAREIATLGRLNAVWAMRGEIPTEGRSRLEAANAAQIRRAYGHIAGVFRSPRWDVMFLPGGVYGSSGVWRRCAQAARIRVATYDTGGYETVMLAADGLACQLHDVPRAFHMLRLRFAERPNEGRAAIAAAEREISSRKLGTDSFESQVRGAGTGGAHLDGGVLVALNSSWDAAALGPHDVFESNTQWILETVRFLLDHTNVPVIVRQHPAERLEFARTSDDYRALLQENFPDRAGLHFIAAADPVNSYELLERVAAVVVHTSTIGIEAAAFGRPVITGSTAYYSDLGFVRRAQTLADYQALLAQAAAGRLTVSEEQRADAKLCMYVTQCCNWVFSVFNPGDYRRWSARQLDAWYAEPAVQRMLNSILTNVPVAVLNHDASTAS